MAASPTKCLTGIPHHDASERGELGTSLLNDSGKGTDIYVSTSCGKWCRRGTDIDLHILVRGNSLCPGIPAKKQLFVIHDILPLVETHHWLKFQALGLLKLVRPQKLLSKAKIRANEWYV